MSLGRLAGLAHPRVNSDGISPPSKRIRSKGRDSMSTVIGCKKFGADATLFLLPFYTPI